MAFIQRMLQYQSTVTRSASEGEKRSSAEAFFLHGKWIKKQLHFQNGVTPQISSTRSWKNSQKILSYYMFTGDQY